MHKFSNIYLWSAKYRNGIFIFFNFLFYFILENLRKLKLTIPTS